MVDVTVTRQSPENVLLSKSAAAASAAEKADKVRLREGERDIEGKKHEC